MIQSVAGAEGDFAQAAEFVERMRQLRGPGGIDREIGIVDKQAVRKTKELD